MDEIKIYGLKFYAYHGCFDFEKREGQYFELDILLKCDLTKAGKTDSLEDTIDYGKVSDVACKAFTERNVNLIECAAQNVAESILLGFDDVHEIEVTVHKPDAPINHEFKDVTVSIKRKWHEAFVAVGSNIGDSKALIDNAERMLSETRGIKITGVSNIITTKPYGVTDQPDFLNGMYRIKTLFTPFELLDILHEIEKANNRERTLRWGPRTLDLDIIYYDDLVLRSEELSIPHIDMCNRSFVLEPLMELAPYKLHPIYKKSTSELLADLY